MNKLLSILLLATSLTFAQDITGSGSSGSPYILYNAADFDSIRYLTDWFGGTTTYYEIANDIDFTSFGSVSEMNGLSSGSGLSIEGNGYTLSNMTITGSGSRQSLFGEFLPGAGGYFSLTNINFDSVSISRTDDEATSTGLIWAYGSMTADAFIVESVRFTNCGIYVTETGDGLDGTTTEAAFIMGYFQFMDAPDEYIKEVVFDACSIVINSTNGRSGWRAGFIGGRTNMGGVTDTLIQNITVRNSVIHIDQPNGNRSNGARSVAGGLFGETTGHPTILNCYSYNNEFYVTLLTVTATTASAGGLIGYTTSITSNECKLENCYTAQITATGSSGAGLGTILGATDSDYVLDSLYSEDHATLSQIGNGSPAGDYFEESTANMKLEGTYVNWDFVNAWGTSGSINDGYPYLNWELSDNLTLTHPTGGETFEQDSVVTITWDNGLTTATYIIGEYSIDGGSNWIRIDSTNNAATSMSWTVPQDIYTTTGQVRVYSNVASARDSSGNFTILPYAVIDFIYPLAKEGVSITVGDTAHIVLETIFVDDFLLYWSKDSTNWFFLDSVEVDTTNGFVLDTTTYIWTFGPTVSGPKIYGRATAVGDTALYSFTRSIIDYDDGYPVNFICQYDEGGDYLQHYFIWDQSCGWAQPPHIYYSRLFPDDGIGPSWELLSESFSHPYTGADFPQPDYVYVINLPDTTPTAWNTFYDDPVDTLEYKQRDYYFDASDSTIRCNDLRNGINGIFVVSLANDWGFGWTVGGVQLQLYNIQRSKLVGQYVTYGIDYETLNDPTFSPIIIVGNTNYADDVFGVAALPAPIDPLYPSDDQLLYTNTSLIRYYFRGIHPKAEKR